MTPPPPPGPHLLGPLLARLRLARGWSQPRLADQLCAASGVPTLSRHEISRWERQLRVPGRFWLAWLAVVLGVPYDRLAAAADASRGAGRPALPGGTAGTRSRGALLALAEHWVADPDRPLVIRPGRLPVATGGPRPAGDGSTGAPRPDDPTDGSGLATLRRLDDLSGGADLAGAGADRLRRVVRALAVAGPAARRPLLPVLAETAQLTGWLAADAGDPVGGLDAYRLGLRAAAAAGDRDLAGYLLASASHLLAGAGDPHGALLLARAGWSGAGRRAPAGLRALLLHRVALAAASGGRHETARDALGAAGRAADRHDPRREPPWLYWLDRPELDAMTGRTLTVLGRPLRAGPLLRAGSRSGQPRGRAVYGGWFARALLQLGEVEQACAVAGDALLDAVRAGSPRAVGQLTEVHRRLAAHRDEPAVRRHRALLAAARPYLPRPVRVVGPRPAARPARRAAGSGPAPLGSRPAARPPG